MPAIERKTFVSEGVILKMLDKSEADKIVILLTPDGGTLRTLAKQAKWSIRRFGGRLGVFNRVKIRYTKKESGLSYLEETELIERFPQISQDPFLFGQAMSIAETLLLGWGEGESAEEVYNFLLRYLKTADRGALDTDRHILEAFRLLAILGYQPMLDSCVFCGVPSERGFYFDIREGGGVCSKCIAEKNENKKNEFIIKLNPQTIRTLQAGYTMKSEKLGRLKFTEQCRKEATSLWEKYVRYLFGVNLKSIEFLKKLESFELKNFKKTIDG